eukprot:9515160-Heterocapsa_arctica.AAC.1
MTGGDLPADTDHRTTNLLREILATPDGMAVAVRDFDDFRVARSYRRQQDDFNPGAPSPPRPTTADYTSDQPTT